MSFSRLRRALVGVAAGALVLSLLPAAGAFADAEEVCENAPEDAFSDATTGVHASNIDCAAAYGLVSGVGGGLFNPGGNLTRGAMATIITNFIETATGDELDVPGSSPFTDIAGNVHAGNITKLAGAGVVSGTSATTFSPNSTVTRQQQATFVANALVEIGVDLDFDAPQAFSDVPDTNPHAANINALADAGVIAGAGGGLFNPGANVTRGQAASFLIGAAGVADDEGVWDADRLPPPPGSSNQTFAVSPTAEVTLVTSTAPATTNAARGYRQYTVPVASGTVSIGLVDADNVSIDGNVVSFETTGTAPNLTAAGIGDTDARIELINGVVNSTTDGDDLVTGVSPVGGNVTFTINTQTPNISVLPVVWVDADPVGSLSVNADGLPTENFGIGGATHYNPPEAGLGVHVANPVVRVSGGSFTSATQTFNFAPTDQFRYSSDTLPLSITHAQFVAWLSVGDDVAVSYNPAGQSIFDITNDVPAAPTANTAVYRGAPNNDVRQTWTAPTNPDIDEFEVQRGTVNTTTGVITWGPDDVDDASPYDWAGLAPGTYAFRVRAVNDNGDEGPWSNVAQATVPAAAVTATPAASASTWIDNGPTGTGAANGILDFGDVIEFAFTQPITLGATWSLDLLDDNGVVRRVSSQFSSAQVLGVNNTVLRITIGTGDPEVVSGVGFDAAEMQIDTATGITNANGSWNLPGSAARQLAGTQPVGLNIADVVLDSTADTVAYDDDTETPLDGDTEYTIRVYTTNGVLVGSATATTSSDGEFPATAIGANLTDGTNYLVTYRATAGDTRHSVAVVVEAED